MRISIFFRVLLGTMLFSLFTPVFGVTKPSYDGLTQETLYYLRKSYEDLAVYFDAKGQKERAKEMRQRANDIPISQEIMQNPPKNTAMIRSAPSLPKINTAPSEKRISSLPFAQNHPVAGPAIYQMLQNMKKPLVDESEKYANYLVNRYLLSLIAKDLETTLDVFDASAALPGYEKLFSQNELKDLYAEIFATYQLETLDIDDFYQLDIPPQFRPINDADVEYILYAQDRAPAALAGTKFWANFFGNVHLYRFKRQEDTWKLVGIRILPLE
ncbi:MAG: hypothetical protein ACRCVN_00760 [Spirochaetia bacterium]